MDNAIVVKDLTKKFGNFTAVNNVSFSVKKGEIFGFLGPNGAGKSTTINLLTTLLTPTSGKIIVAGKDVIKEPGEVRKKISLISQEGSVDGDLTAEENLFFYGKLYHVEKNVLKERVERALKFVNLEEKKKIQVRFFSGGMRRRLEIAKVFVSEPEIIFLDEPTIGLDPQSREMIWKKIFEINRTKGTTIFLTTHYMQEAEFLCNRIAIIDKGKIISIGTPAELKKSTGIVEIVEFSTDKSAELFIERLKKQGFEAEELFKGRIRVFSHKKGLSELIKKLAKKFSSNIFEIVEKNVTMEDVFLHYTGRSVRDEETDGNYLTKIIAKRIRGG